MPFTLSHPLAVVPFVRGRLIFSALVVGSMSPDFEYFLRLRQDGHVSHTIAGIFTICLPSGLVVLWLWHELLKRPLLELLPEEHRVRLCARARDFSFGPVRRFLCVCASLVIGTVTHIAWDSLTHGWGMPVHGITALEVRVALPGLSAMPVYRYLQHASSLLGLCGLLGIYVMWFRNAKKFTSTAGLILPQNRTRFLAVGTGVAITIGAVVAARRFPLSDPENLRGFVVRSAVVSISALTAQALVFALWFRRRFPGV